MVEYNIHSERKDAFINAINMEIDDFKADDLAMIGLSRESSGIDNKSWDDCYLSDPDPEFADPDHEFADPDHEFADPDHEFADINTYINMDPNSSPRNIDPNISPRNMDRFDNIEYPSSHNFNNLSRESYLYLTKETNYIPDSNNADLEIPQLVHYSGNALVNLDELKTPLFALHSRNIIRYRCDNLDTDCTEIDTIYDNLDTDCTEIDSVYATEA